MMEQVVITSWLFLLITLVLIGLIGVSNIVCIKTKGIGVSKEKYILRAAFFFYIAIVASFTLFPICYPAMLSYDIEYNLDPRPLLQIFVNRAALITYAENILLFIPITILGYFNDFKWFKSMKGALIVSLLISISIEALQGLEVYIKCIEDFAPIMDINDVICNVVGGLIGFVLGAFYKKGHKKM